MAGLVPETPGRIHAITRLRIGSDGPGVRSVVFLYGCPLQCRWCCNPDTRFGEDYTAAGAGELYALLERDALYYAASGGGVTFTGGEPLLQYRFVEEFARLVSGRYSIRVETSLYAPQEAVQALLPWVEHWYVDYKGGSAHRENTGVSDTVILENLALLCQSDPSRVTMTWPLIAGVTDREPEVLIQRMRSLGIRAVQLHPSRSTGEKYAALGLPEPGFAPFPAEREAELRTLLTAAGLRVEDPEDPREREKCRYLKEIRRELSRKHGIGLEFPECTHTGPCPGTCPKCEGELDTIRAFLAQTNENGGEHHAFHG